jgi:hypothetical protein
VRQHFMPDVAGKKAQREILIFCLQSRALRRDAGPD